MVVYENHLLVVLRIDIETTKRAADEAALFIEEDSLLKKIVC